MALACGTGLRRPGSRVIRLGESLGRSASLRNSRTPRGLIFVTASRFLVSGSAVLADRGQVIDRRKGDLFRRWPLSTVNTLPRALAEAFDADGPTVLELPMAVEPPWEL